MNRLIAIAEERARRFRPPTVALRPAAPNAAPAPGQVWTLRRPTGRIVAVVLLRPGAPDADGRAFDLVAPLLDEAEYAGPTDLFLPKEIFGHIKIVAVGCACTLSRKTLGVCRGALPGAWPQRLTSFLAHTETGASRPAGVLTGPPYLDKRDLRYLFHQQLADDLAAPQAAARRELERPNRKPARRPTILTADFSGFLRALDEHPGYRALPMAAASLDRDSILCVYWPLPVFDPRGANFARLLRRTDVRLFIAETEDVVRWPAGASRPPVLQFALPKNAAIGGTRTFYLIERAEGRVVARGDIAPRGRIATVREFLPAPTRRAVQGGNDLLLLIVRKERS